MTRALGMAILLASVAGFAFGGNGPIAPEIDASSGAAALGLLAGGLLILRSRRKKS
jgi:MYXO-CTERM domain-containing protein